MYKQYIVTERAHYMCPYMNIGIRFDVNSKYDRAKVEETIDKLADVHIFLRSNLKLEDNHIFYDIKQKSTIIFEEKNSDSVFAEDYKKEMTSYWNVFEQGLLKIFVYPHDEKFTVLYIAHHLLGDGRSIMQLVEDFVRLYNGQFFENEHKGRIIKDIGDFAEGSELSLFSKFYINYLNKKWEKEDKIFPHKKYENFFCEFTSENPVDFEYILLDQERLSLIKKRCKQNFVSVNSAILSAVSLKTRTDKIVIAADVRNKIKCYEKGNIGNFATGISISCKSNSTDIYKRAKEIDTKVKKKINNNNKLMLILSCYLNMSETLIDAMVPASFGAFGSKAAKLAGKMLGYDKRSGIGVTNLGKYEINGVENVVFIAPASTANIQTIGVVTVNGKMAVASSFCENLILSELAKKQLKDIVELL